MKRATYRRDERGVALFMSLFALLLLTSIALGLMFIANTETSVNYNYRGSLQAFYAAKAGTQDAVERLRPEAPIPAVRPTTMPTTSAGTGVVYLINKTSSSEEVTPWSLTLSDGTINPVYDNELCNERFVDSSGVTPLLGATFVPSGAGIPCGNVPTGTYYTSIASALTGTGTSAAIPYKWARITQKQNGTFSPYCPNGDCTSPDAPVCWTGDHQIPKPSTYSACDAPPVGAPKYAPVYVITALASTVPVKLGTNKPNGSRRYYQAEYAPMPPIAVSSAVTSKDSVNLTGNLQVNGYDQCSCQCATTGSGAATKDAAPCVARAPYATCDNTKSAIYSAGDVDNPNSSQNILAGTGPIIQDVPSWPSNLEVGPLIDTLKPGSTNVATCTSGICTLNSGTDVLGTLPTPFPPTDPASVTTAGQVSYVDGNITLNGGGGSGILIVNGDLTIHGGGFQWYGLILVRGVVTFQGGGSADTNIYGAVIAGENTNANADTTLGGSVNIKLDTCALANSFKNRPLTYISSRELLY
ncbi:MAG TPA: hypothetical protein VN577_00335 [Terriglobales bacterium]|nr:hypothetical protein [Terriglobales bacterium]